MVDLIADSLLVAACLGAAFYCMLLSRKINKLNQFETGLGGAIAVLSAQVDEVQKTLIATEKTASYAGEELKALLVEANEVSTRLDFLLAGVDDLPEKNEDNSPIFSRSNNHTTVPDDLSEKSPEEMAIFRRRHARVTS